MEMEGLGQKQACHAIHDDLFVRALFLEQEDRQALLLSFDLLFFERAVVDRYKGALGRALALRPDQIFLNTTHTHTGPRMTRWQYGGAPDPLYLDQIESAAQQAAQEARIARKPVTIEAGTTQTMLPVNRRKIGPNGKAEWKPYRSGPIYDSLPFCLLKDADGHVVSVLFSVACHPSMIYEHVISAEYPGAAVRKLNEAFSTEGSIFLQGAAGDTKPRHVADGEEAWRSGTWEQMEEAGREIADAVLTAAQGKLASVQPELKTLLTEAPWPLEPPPSADELKSIRDDPKTTPHRCLWANDMLLRLERVGWLPTDVPIGIHFLQLGTGLRIIGIEGEVLARLGLKIHKLYDKGITFVLGYTNGTQIYMPVSSELSEGGYEVDSYWEYHQPAPAAPGCEQPLLDAVKAAHDGGKILNCPIQ